VLLAGGSLANFVFGSSTVALPMIARGTGATPDAAGLVIALFSVGFAAVLVLSGRLGDRFGRRRVFAAGLAALTLTSLAVALSPSLWVLLVMRTLQGVAAGVMLPQVLSTIQATTTGERRGRLSAGYVTALAVGATLGQLLGGALSSTTASGWRWALASTAVFAALALVGVRLVPDTRTTGAHGGIDAPGAALFATFVTALLVPTAMVRTVGWRWWVVALLVVAAVAVATFAWWERRLPTDHALAPPAILRQPVMLAGLGMTGLFFSGYGAFVSIFGLMTQDGLGMSPVGSGLAFLPFALGFLAASVLGPRLAGRVAPALVMRAGALAQALCLVGVAVVMLTEWPHPQMWVLQPVLVLLGAAQGIMFPPIVGIVMAAVPREVVGLASGLLTTAQQLFTAVGVAAFGLLYASLSATSVGTAFAACVLVQMVLALLFAGGAGRAAGVPGPAVAVAVSYD